MQIPAIIYTRTLLSTGSQQVLFSVAGNLLVEFDLAKHSPNDFAQKNRLIRHDKFDWHVNKQRPICYIFEKQSPLKIPLPDTIHSLENEIPVQWLIFPAAAKRILNGTHRNLLQLSVQYISYGMIDDSVIAADYDAEFLEKLREP